MQDILLKLAGNENLWAMLFIYLLIIITWYVKQTASKKDDVVWHGIHGLIAQAFNFAEQYIPDDTENKNLQLVDKGLKEFNRRYAERFKKEPTQKELEYAKDELALLECELKKN